MAQPDLVIVSNRGPLSFTYSDDGGLVPRRGGGGLVSSLGPAVVDSGATWIAGAISPADREAARSNRPVEAEGFRLRSLIIDEGDYRRFYDVVANSTLWFLHHNLWDLSRRPRFDRRWREAWESYRAVNLAFAEAVVEEAAEGATVLVHDYHLTLLGRVLAKERPDLKTAHFHHTPFCDPAALRVLPDDIAAELLDGLAGHRSCGFHSARWAANFVACAASVGVEPPDTFVAPAASDVDEIETARRSPACAAELASLDQAAGDRAVIVRVDRIELSKNIARGFEAFDDLLRTRPEWRERVVFAAYTYPSRESLPDYMAYRQEIETLVARINHRWQTPGWTPIILDTSDDYPRSVAALRRYDVLLVNPMRDGLNLVAKEGAILNERDGVLVLSPEAGVWDELGPAALRTHPFDVAGTADALHEALSMGAPARAEMAAALRRAATRRSPADWLNDQLRAARH